MRHKQRPVKSSRHKSVTFIIDSHTSFGDHNEPQHNHQHQHQNQNLQKQQQQHQQQQQSHPRSPHRQPTSHRPQRSQNSNHGGGSASQAATANQQIGSPNFQPPNSRTVDAGNDESPPMRKQFEHNYRHMSDVMRLAFLENNDISIDDCANVDFNSLSTASILQRNIQQQLQQERRNQLNNHHHQQQQQQQRLHHHQSFQNHPHNRQQEFEHDLVDESYDNVEDYEMSDSRIFATATPNSSTNRINLTSSTPKSSHQQASGSGGAQRAGIKNGNSAGSKRRAKEATPRVEFSNQVQVETIQNYGDGFLCDEPGCGKSFPSLRKLRHHKVVHSDDFPFVCEFKGCAKKFKRKFGIDLHSTTHFDLDPGMYSKTSNNSSLPFFGRRMQYSMCKPCGQKFKTVHEYQYHMLKHGKEPFKCPVKGCGQTFGIWKSFQKHRASHYFNYYCKMDPRCDHHTSNLQLLKLHIYCCHFRRKLPENATLASRDPPDDETEREDHVEVICPEDQSTETSEKHENQSGEDEDSISMTDSQPKSEVSTPRRDSRLRKNPPRSSTFGHQDYASINNGSGFAKCLSAQPNSKRSRASISSSSQSIGSQSITPIEKKIKLPLKVLPKRSAQRLPMSLIADDGSTEDEGHSSDGDSFQNEGEEQDLEPDPTKRNKFKCHLCDYKFSVRFQLTKHLSTHLELTPEMYSATADKQVVQLSERRRREFYCDKCSVKFEHMPDLDVHMRKHGQRPYVCNFCQVPSTFRLAKQYLSHLYEHRFNYKCTMAQGCDFTINRKDALKLHIFRMHLNQQLPSYIENFANMIDCNEWPEQ